MVNKKQGNGLIQRKFLGQCSALRKDGQRCRAIANKETGLCSIHGGLVPRLEGDIDISKDLVSVRKFLARTAMSLKRGKIKANDANALANLCDKLIKVYQLMEGEAKLDEMRRLMDEYMSGNADYEVNEDLRVLESEYKDQQ